MSMHTEHVTIKDALGLDCLEGECEHIDEDGQPEDYAACPKLTLEVCVDCQDEHGWGRDPKYWEELIGWPCKPENRISELPLLEPAIFKTYPEENPT